MEKTVVTMSHHYSFVQISKLKIYIKLLSVTSTVMFRVGVLCRATVSEML